MKLTITIDGRASWLILKDAWSRRDMREWEQATNPAGVLSAEEASGEAPMPTVDERTARLESRVWGLLDRWSSEAHLEISGERIVHRVGELTPEDGLDMDAALYRFLMQAPWTAFQERSRLGEPTVERS